METHYIFYRIYCTAFALFKKKKKKIPHPNDDQDGLCLSSHASFCCPLHNLHWTLLDPVICSWVSFLVPLFSLTSDKTLKREYFLVEHYYISNGLQSLPRCCNNTMIEQWPSRHGNIFPSSNLSEKNWKMNKQKLVWECYWWSSKGPVLSE